MMFAFNHFIQKLTEEKHANGDKTGSSKHISEYLIENNEIPIFIFPISEGNENIFREIVSLAVEIWGKSVLFD